MTCRKDMILSLLLCAFSGEEAAARDEEAAQFSRFGGNGPGFMSV